MPDWTNKAQALEPFTDVRDIQKTLVSRGIQPLVPADEASSGPAHLVLADPDGNPILIDDGRLLRVALRSEGAS